jgi:hypothetical protein
MVHYSADDRNVSDYNIFHLRCANAECNKISVIAKLYYINGEFDKQNKYHADPLPEQVDIYPSFTCKHFPEYVPLHIRKDYEEGVAIIDNSPRAAATMFRSCMHELIKDHFGVHKKNLSEAIDAIESEISKSMWKALTAVRQFGNIGAHLKEKDGVILDVEKDEAIQLQRIIERLIETWYVQEHADEDLSKSLSENPKVSEKGDKEA